LEPIAGSSGRIFEVLGFGLLVHGFGNGTGDGWIGVVENYKARCPGGQRG
jgi:hypothetical protein